MISSVNSVFLFAVPFVHLSGYRTFRIDIATLLHPTLACKLEHLHRCNKICLIMSTACDHCAKPVKSDEESVTCIAFCDRMIHLRCSANAKLNKPFMNIVQSCPNLAWMCDECAKLMKCCRFKSAMVSFGCALEAITEKQEQAHAELRKEIAKQGQQIAQLSKGFALSTPTLLKPELPERQPPLKRRRHEISPSKPLVGGTKVATEDNAFTEVLTVPEPKELFWLYLSRIHPSVKPESIEKLVKDCVQCEDLVKVVPLIKKDADMSRLSFISYKIGLDPKLREIALSAETWPKGILFREFENGNSKNMWLPRLDSPTVTISPVPGPSQYSTPTTGVEPMC